MEKMKWIGFNKKTLSILSSYLENRHQYVVVKSFPSDPLAIGPQSVTQGSSLSCMLYIIYILDIMGIYHDRKHSPAKSTQKPSMDYHSPSHPNSNIQD